MVKQDVRYALITACLLAAIPAAADDPPGVDVRMPLVEQALAFVRARALDPPSDAVLLAAGARRVCGAELDAAGCSPPGAPIPGDQGSGPGAAMAWRGVLESALAAERIRHGEAFDAAAFERYVVDGMIAALGDPNSFYIAPTVYRRITAIPHDFAGFGLTAIPEEDCLRALSVHPGSPAAAAGLRGGERIVAVNGSPVTGYHRPAGMAALWGGYGERIDLEVRLANGAARAFSLDYHPWQFTPLEVGRQREVAVVRIRHFSAGVAQAVGRELGGASGRVLDLRSASGGLDEEMAALADLLLGQAPIGSRVMRDDLGSRSWNAAVDTPGERLDVMVAVVIGPGTGGLAEVLAAALRSSRRAILIGTTTAGRDSLETIRPLGDGSAIQITSTRLLGPDGTALGAGVLPHVETRRPGLTDLARRIVELSAGSELEQLIAAARAALAEP